MVRRRAQRHDPSCGAGRARCLSQPCRKFTSRGWPRNSTPQTLVPVGDGACPACGAPPVCSMVVGLERRAKHAVLCLLTCAARCGITRASNARYAAQPRASPFRRLPADRRAVKAETCDSCRSYVKILQQHAHRFARSGRRRRRDTCSRPFAARTRNTGAAGSILSCSAIERTECPPKPISLSAPCRRSTDVLKADAATLAVAQFGRPAAVAAVRQTLDATRAALRAGKTASNQPEAIGEHGARQTRDRRTIELAAGLQSHGHRVAHQSRPRIAGRGRDRGRGRRHALRRGAGI